jgi:hypothetical protein
LRPSPPVPRDTTFTAGSAESVHDRSYPSDRGISRGARFGIAGLVAAAAIAGGYFVFGKGGGVGGPAPSGPVAVAPSPPKPAEPLPSAGDPPAVPKAPLAKVTVRLNSEPSGAKVKDGRGDDLGVTPLVLSRPRGGALELSLSKDGYAEGARTVSLESDQTVDLKLEQLKPAAKPKLPKKPHTPRPAQETNEPAKL